MKQSNLGTLSRKLYFPYRLKRQITEKINIGLLTEFQACEKYGISRKLIRQWRRSYYKHRILSPLNTSSMKSKKTFQDEIKALKAKLAATEKAYQEEKVKARAYEIMTVPAGLKSLKNSLISLSEKVWAQVANEVIREFPLHSVEKTCQLFGVSRSAFYKAEKRINKQCLQEVLVLAEVRQIKKDQPKLGTEKVYLMIRPFLNEHAIKMGRVGPTGISFITY